MLRKEGLPEPTLHKMMQEMASDDLQWKENMASGVWITTHSPRAGIPIGYLFTG